MTIEQKAREIAAKASGASGYITEREIEASRLGIIEGRRQAFEEAAAFLVKLSLHDEATAIRALIEEQKAPPV